MPLTSLLWLFPIDRPPTAQLTLLLSSFLYVWDKTIIKYRISSRPGPLTPILGKPRFLTSQSDNRCLCWQPSRPLPIWHALHRVGLKPLGELSSLPHSNSGHWLQYFQLSHFYKGLAKVWHCGELTQFEKLCLSDSNCSHVLPKIYGMLLFHVFPNCPFYV